MAYWQISSGDGVVDLEYIFIKLNVALIGPGHLGDYFDHKQEYQNLADGHILRIFAEEVIVNDMFILKRMVNPRTHEWEIKAVGQVISPYRFEPIFERVDVSQWAMQHCRRVAWKVPKQPTIVHGGGAPIRFQRVDDSNPLMIKARELMND